MQTWAISILEQSKAIQRAATMLKEISASDFSLGRRGLSDSRELLKDRMEGNFNGQKNGTRSGLVV
jgi:hypothetical protein